MLRKNSIVKFVFLIIIAFLGILLCVCPFNVPASTDRYNSLLTSIEKGIDLNGGVVALYDCTLPNGNQIGVDKAIDSSLDKIYQLFDKEGYKELRVVRQGDSHVRIEAAGAKESDYSFSYIENYKNLSITLEQYSETLTNPKVFVTSSDIATAYSSYDYENSAYIIVIEFNNDGLKNLEKLKTYSNETSLTTAYVYLGDINSDNLFSEISVSDLKDKTSLSVSSNGSYTMSSSSEAKEIAYSIVSGSLDVKMAFEECCYISPALGENTQLLILIAFLVVIGMSLLFLSIKYGDFGLLGTLAMTYFVIFFVFFLQAIPLIILDLAGVFGILLSYVIAIFSIIVIFEKIRSEYAVGKKIYISCKSGLKKSLWLILDSHFLIILSALFIWIFAPLSLKCFAINLFVGMLLSMFTSLVVLRYFIKIYLPINSTNAKRLNLYRDKDVKELKEDEVEVIETADSVEGGSYNE